MFVESATTAVLVAALTLCSTMLQVSVTNKPASPSKKLDCVFGKEGAPSKVRIKLDSKDSGEDSNVYQGRIWMDQKPMFPGSIKFLYSKTEDGKATLGAGVLTQKQKLFYTELFINFDPESGKATFEAATTNVSTTLEGSCAAK